jgi:hypothetical protein
MQALTDDLQAMTSGCRLPAHGGLGLEHATANVICRASAEATTTSAAHFSQHVPDSSTMCAWACMIWKAVGIAPMFGPVTGRWHCMSAVMVTSPAQLDGPLEHAIADPGRRPTNAAA